MTTSNIVKKQTEELCKSLDIVYEKDIKLIKTTLELAYWTGRAEQTKIMQEQQEMEKLMEVIPDVNGTYYN